MLERIPRNESIIASTNVTFFGLSLVQCFCLVNINRNITSVKDVATKEILFRNYWRDLGCKSVNLLSFYTSSYSLFCPSIVLNH